MKIRLGYACISNSIDTSSSSYTYSSFSKNNDYEKLDSIIKYNLNSLEKIIDYNIKNNIHFYRLSSKIIPLATKDDVIFDYTMKYKNYYKKIGDKINNSFMRVDFHPDQFAVLNSTKKEVVNNTIEILKYHYNLLDMLNIKNKLLVLHIGSSVFGKENSLRRFINNFNLLPLYLRECIAIENDDKVFNIEDCIKIANVIDVPIILDYHHYMCNKSDLEIERVLNSFKENTPKMHFSSPKNKKEYRSHSDYIDSDSFISFTKLLKKYDRDVDIMIEAKMKDDALFRLVREIKYKTNYLFIDDTTFIV